MRFDTGTTDVATAGTQVQVSNTRDKVLWIQFRAPAANSGLTYVGLSDVSATNGYTLGAAGDIDSVLTLNFGTYGGSVEFNKFWGDAATNGDNVDWAVILV